MATHEAVIAERTAGAGPLRALGERARFWVGLGLFGLTCMTWSLVAALLYRLLPRPLGTRVGQFGIMAGFRFFLEVMEWLGVFRCDLRALDALRDEAGLVIAPNHPSLLDAVVVVSRLPRVVCITKASLWDNPFLGGSVRLAGYIRNDSRFALIRDAAAALAEGRQLLIFPEGTRTVRPPVDAFKGGFVLMARAAGAPVQTVLIEIPGGYLGKGWRLFRRPALPIVVRARLGRRFDTAGQPTHEVMAAMERYFGAALAGDGGGAAEADQP